MDTIERAGIRELLDTERALILDAPTKYGSAFDHALNSSIFLSNFVKSTKPLETLVAFLSVAKKDHLLAVFSIARQHKVQAMMNLRHFLEAAVDAVFAMENPSAENFVTELDSGILDVPQKLRGKRYKWLEEKHPGSSKSIVEVKGALNETMSHTNLVLAQANFKRVGKTHYEAPFFDADDQHFIRADFWLAGKCALVALDLFFGVNETTRAIELVDNFQGQFDYLLRQNFALRDELMKDPHYTRAEARRVENPK